MLRIARLDTPGPLRHVGEKVKGSTLDSSIALLKNGFCSGRGEQCLET